MKTVQLTKVILALMALVTVMSCVQDDDFGVPVFENQVATPNGNIVPISSVAGAVAQAMNNGNANFSFQGTENYIEGYVVSSDASGNWFEEFIIQDAPENPTIGIRVLIDESPLFTSYELGRKVFVKLDGLTAGISNGVLSIGFLDGSTIAKIPAPLQNEFIQRSTTVAEIVPKMLEFSDFSESNTNQFIVLNDVQFNADAVINNQLTFSSEPNDEFDGERVLESCVSGIRTILSTSTFADFGAFVLPAGRGTVQGILTKDFFGEVFTIVINNAEDINFDNEDRCDLCGVATATGNAVIFEDNLNSGSLSPLWTNYAQEGTEIWEAFDTDSSFGTAARIGSFLSGDESTIAWLITPEIDFEVQAMETINFETSNSFADGSTLVFLFSQDWDGDVATITAATWNPILESIIVPDDTFFEDWVPSNSIDISCLTGSGYFAFRYQGSGDSDFDGTFELDNFIINGA